MNIPVLIVACGMALAVLAHVLIGTRETATLRPEPGAAPKKTDNWVQAMCAFQMLSVDAVAVTAALFSIVLFDFGPAERPLILGLAALFALWGIVWVLQSYWVQRDVRALFRLPHWLIWFGASGLLIWGS